MRAGAGVVGRRAWWGAGRGAGVAGADLVHEIPPALISPFPLHQVPRVSLPVAGAGLVHEIPPALISPFPLHQVPRVSSPVAGAVLVHEIPPALISPFPLHQVPRVFSPVAGADLVHEIPRVLISPFPLHQVPRISSPVAGGRGASPPANPCFFVLGHHALEHSSRSRRAGVVPHRSLALVSSSWGTTPSSTDEK